MRLSVPRSLTLVLAVVLSAAAVSASRAEQSARATPLKDAQAQHRAQRDRRGHRLPGLRRQRRLAAARRRGPGGQVLEFEGRGSLAKLGLTELFFESVEPENAEVPIDEMLAKLPEGNYTISGPTQGTARARAARRARHGSRTTSRQARGSSPPRRARPCPARRGRALEAGIEDDHRRPGQDHRVPADRREGRRAAPAHDRQARAEHVPPAFGHEHRRPERLPRAPHRGTRGKCWRSSAAATRRSRRASSEPADRRSWEARGQPSRFSVRQPPARRHPRQDVEAASCPVPTTQEADVSTKPAKTDAAEAA